MKASICGKLALFIALMMASLYVSADTETVGGVEWTYTVMDGKASIESGWGNVSAISAETAGDLDVPAVLGGFPVVSIGTAAFWDCSNLVYVTIPNSVTNIGAYAFQGCSGLVSISIPNGVESIGYGAFVECDSLMSFSVDARNLRYKSVNGCIFRLYRIVVNYCWCGEFELQIG